MNTDFAEQVKKARNGDADAFAELYSLVYKELYRIALVNLKNQHDASDAVSDAVLEAYSSIKKLRDEKAFKAWIIKILTVKIKRKQREYIKIRDYQTDLEDLENSVEQKESAEINYGGLEIMEEFRRLNEEERLILSLSVVSGYTSEEIAKVTGLSANTVRSKAARAKIKLKQMLEEH
ncbi:MAG: sigma-70 family RNA polymerase sigma factor [Ruminococcus sp.]|nr:sigma-70 family RNA polymerase sigma factor [Ruminococcus sp.]MCM1380468.1 sigma-70 family RNA polymerase sigma factor [Muribaculaceae bacterium]MCM1479545.1 sigma-70 family RNA polymerase sigma factor [Muribaculaceae bacterium]